jgi:archaellum component FlaC
MNCEICDRASNSTALFFNEPVCRRVQRNDELRRFEAAHAGMMVEPELLRKYVPLVNAAEAARLDCEQHKVDWREIALEQREIALEQRKKLEQRTYSVATLPEANLLLRDSVKRLEIERNEARIALDNAGQRDRSLSMAESIGRLADELIAVEATVKQQNETITRQAEVINELSTDDYKSRVKLNQSLDALSKNYTEATVRINALQQELNDTKTMRDVYKVRCEKLQKHAQEPIVWQRTVEDVVRLASLYTHDMALPTSTNAEVALGRAVEYLAELVREGAEIVEAICSGYEIRTARGTRAPSLENWARRWLGHATAKEPAPSAVAPPLESVAELEQKPEPAAPLDLGCLGPNWP